MVLTLEFNLRRWTCGIEWASVPLDKDGWQYVNVFRFLLPVFAIHFERLWVNR